MFLDFFPSCSPAYQELVAPLVSDIICYKRQNSVLNAIENKLKDDITTNFYIDIIKNKNTKIPDLRSTIATSDNIKKYNDRILSVLAL